MQNPHKAKVEKDDSACCLGDGAQSGKVRAVQPFFQKLGKTLLLLGPHPWEDCLLNTVSIVVVLEKAEQSETIRLVSGASVGAIFFGGRNECGSREWRELTLL